MNIIESITARQLKNDIPEFRVGDIVRVDYKIIEGKKERIQAYEGIQYFEGIVIARKGTGIAETFTVRKVSSGVGVERIFPLHSPKIESITVTRKGKARRAKLYFLRDRKSGYKMKESNK